MAEPNEVDQLLDQMLKGKTPEENLGKNGVLKGLTKRLCKRSCKSSPFRSLKSRPPLSGAPPGATTRHAVG